MMGFSRENCIKALSVFADEDFALDWLLSQQENIDNLETKNSQKLRLDSLIMDVERYKNILDEHKIKIYNDFNKYEKCIYCDDCKNKIDEEFIETRKRFKLDLFKL